MGAIARTRLERQRRPQLRVDRPERREHESGGHHGGHRIHVAIQSNGPSDGPGIGPESRLPQLVGDHDLAAIPALERIGRGKPPVQRRNAEQRQRVLRDTQSEHALDAIVEAHVGAPVLGRPHRRKAARFTAPILEVGPGHRTAAVVHDDDQLVGVGVGQWTQDDAAQRREHRRVGADGHAQHQDDRRADHRRANEAAQRIAHVAPERLERAHAARVTMRLAHAIQSAEGLAGLAPRVLLGEPAGSRVALGQFEMSGDLVLEFAVEAALAKERRQPLRQATHDRAPRNLAMSAVDCSQLTISWRR